jgi:hypothetical protein
VIGVREDVLREEDGPMLKYGLQALHHWDLAVQVSVSPNRASEDVIEVKYHRLINRE